MGMSFLIIYWKIGLSWTSFYILGRKDQKSRKKEVKIIIKHSLSKIKVLTFRGKLRKSQI